MFDRRSGVEHIETLLFGGRCRVAAAIEIVVMLVRAERHTERRRRTSVAYRGDRVAVAPVAAITSIRTVDARIERDAYRLTIGRLCRCVGSGVGCARRGARVRVRLSTVGQYTSNGKKHCSARNGVFHFGLSRARAARAVQSCAARAMFRVGGVGSDAPICGSRSSASWHRCPCDRAKRYNLQAPRAHDAQNGRQSAARTVDPCARLQVGWRAERVARRRAASGACREHESWRHE